MEKLTLNECAVHARSKKEVYELLVIQGNVLLPPIQEWDHQFIKEIIQGKKQVSRFQRVLCLAYKGKECQS